jgi:hypothetical protein
MEAYRKGLPGLRTTPAREQSELMGLRSAPSSPFDHFSHEVRSHEAIHKTVDVVHFDVFQFGEEINILPMALRMEASSIPVYLIPILMASPRFWRMNSMAFTWPRTTLLAFSG